MLYLQRPCSALAHPGRVTSAPRSITLDAVRSIVSGSRDSVIGISISSSLRIARGANHSSRSSADLRRHFLRRNRRADPDVLRPSGPVSVDRACNRSLAEKWGNSRSNECGPHWCRGCALLRRQHSFRRENASSTRCGAGIGLLCDRSVRRCNHAADFRSLVGNLELK
jgi:hypothetical protein